MERGIGPAPGQLLVATDPGRGGYFDQAVVLIVEHNPGGTLGVCLHQLSEVDMVDALEEFTPLLSPPAQLFEGGPVNERMALCLAQVSNPDDEPVGWRRVFDDVGVLDLDTPIELVENAFSQVRIFAGLTGWDSGQLEAELIRGSWHRIPAHAEDVFGTPYDLWRRCLRRMGGTLGRWSTWTEAPEYN